ncbi:MAG: HipA family kinase [Betaproteobacteria bacterium]
MFRTGTLTRGVLRKPGTQIWLGTISTAQEGFFRGFVKVLPTTQFISESVCAWILQRLGVPTPEPFWVMVHRQVLPSYRGWQRGEQRRICFATREIPAQSLWIETKRDLSALMNLEKWVHTLAAGMFDELVVNDDREPKNVLTDGRGRYWLIDHNHAFGSDKWTPEWLRDNAFPSFSNRLLEVLSKTTPGRRIKLGKEAPEHSDVLAKLLRKLPLHEVSKDLRTRNAVNWFLLRRAERLVDMTHNRLGLPQLPLSPKP